MEDLGAPLENLEGSLQGHLGDIWKTPGAPLERTLNLNWRIHMADQKCRLQMHGCGEPEP